MVKNYGFHHVASRHLDRSFLDIFILCFTHIRFPVITLVALGSGFHNDSG
jgi:hypothetical protein